MGVSSTRMAQHSPGPIPRGKPTGQGSACVIGVPGLGVEDSPQVGGTCRQEVSKGTDSLATSLVWEQMVSGYTGPLSTWAW